MRACVSVLRNGALGSKSWTWFDEMLLHLFFHAAKDALIVFVAATTGH